MPRAISAREVINAFGEGQFREVRGPDVPMHETSFYLGSLTAESLMRLESFLGDLARRYPLPSPAWTAHREALEAFASDVRREITRREAAGDY